MLDFMFDRKCSFQVETKEGIDLEELELELIDYGVEEIFQEDESIMLFAEFSNFGLYKSIAENDFNIKSFRFERIPNECKSITEEQQKDVDSRLKGLKRMKT